MASTADSTVPWPVDHDHDGIGVQVEGTGEHLHPVDPRHLEIGENDLGALALEE
jgi:hypothetical protein